MGFLSLMCSCRHSWDGRDVWFNIFVLSMIVGWFLALSWSWARIMRLETELGKSALPFLQPFRRFLMCVTLFFVSCTVALSLVVSASLSNSTLMWRDRANSPPFNMELSATDILNGAQPAVLLIGTAVAWMRPRGGGSDAWTNDDEPDMVPEPKVRLQLPQYHAPSITIAGMGMSMGNYQ